MSGGATLSDNATELYADPLHAREVGAAVADHEAALRVRVRDLGPRWEATRSHHHERRQPKALEAPQLYHGRPRGVAAVVRSRLRARREHGPTSTVSPLCIVRISSGRYACRAGQKPPF